MPGKAKPKGQRLELCRIAQIINSLPTDDRRKANQIVQELMDGTATIPLASFCRALSKMVGHVPISTMSIHVNGVCACDPK